MRRTTSGQANHHGFALIIPVAVTLAAGLSLAGCGTGQQLAAGPVLGYVRGRGPSFGWEAGGGAMETTRSLNSIPSIASMVSRVNVGMSWRPGQPGTDAWERITYAAWEPWLYLGGTAGVAHSSARDGLQALLGVWEGIPYIVGGSRLESAPVRCSPCYTVSLSLGWRWGGDGEFYLSPKFGILNDVWKPFPFAHD